MTELAGKRCVPCEGGIKPLDRAAAEQLMKQLGAPWKLSADGKQIAGSFEFKNYYRTTAFVNAIAWIAHNEDHHPDITFGSVNTEEQRELIGGAQAWKHPADVAERLLEGPARAETRHDGGELLVVAPRPQHGHGGFFAVPVLQVPGDEAIQRAVESETA